MAVKDGGNCAKGRKVLFKAAEDLCKRAVKIEENKVTERWNKIDKKGLEK